MRVLTLAPLLALVAAFGCRCDVDPLPGLVPHMKVSPSEVVLRGVPVAQDTRIVIQVQNDAIINLETLHAELREASDPAFVLQEDYPHEVFAGQTGEIVVLVRPRLVSTIEAVLVITGDGFETPIETDDAKPSAHVEVPITVEAIDAGLPDICEYPESIAFGRVGINDVGRVDASWENCGVRDLLIDAAFFCPTLVDGATPDPEYPECGDRAASPIRVNTALPPGMPMPPRTGATIELLFRPTDLEEHTGDLVILSNDPLDPAVLIPVTAEGAACPVAVAELVDDAEGIEPFDTVRVNGANSQAADGGQFLGRYEWSVQQRPGGSTAQPFPNDEQSTEVETDVGGHYEVNLHVYEQHEDGEVRSCVPATVEFDVVSSEELLIQLVWDHPTADLDLHLVRGGGTEFTHEDDVYFSNREPQQTEDEPAWSAVPEENPVLDVDDHDGYGPENLNIVAPADNSEWRVLVHYWNRLTDADPRTTATVRVFVYGQQVMEVSRTFETDEQLWEALDITWPATEGDPAALSQLGVVREYPRPF